MTTLDSTERDTLFIQLHQCREHAIDAIDALRDSLRPIGKQFPGLFHTEIDSLRISDLIVISRDLLKVASGNAMSKTLNAEDREMDAFHQGGQDVT